MATQSTSSTPSTWSTPSPPPPPAPGPNEVHVWRVKLDGPPHRLNALRALLSPDELARAERFHFPRDRDHYIAARGALRTVLGRALGLPPGQVRFAYGPQGKPSLANTPAALPLRFNLSHSGGLALIAVAHGREVGIDVEQVRPRLLVNLPPESVFSPCEAARLAALPEASRGQDFFECWTRKEAFIKALGGGLSIALDGFSVSLEANEPPRLVEVQAEYGPPERWAMAALQPGEGYAAALVVEGHGWRLHQLDFDERLFEKETAAQPED